jgi:transcriptional regulator with XRE-family HTH domain
VVRRSAHIDSPERLGTRLRTAREKAGLRLADLAFQGCSLGYLSHIERGRRVPSLQVIRELARRLAVSETWLATGVAQHEQAEPSLPDALVEAEAALRFDDLDTAERLYRAALDSALDAAVQARALAGLGQLAFRRDDSHAAIRELEEARALEQDVEADPSFVETLGRAYADVGETEAAVSLFRRRLQAAQEAEDPIAQVRFAVLLANALIDLSAFAEASQVLADVLSDPVNDDPVLLARLYWSQSRLHAMKQETASASRYAQKALELLEATEFTQYRARAHHLLAYIEIDAGNHTRALDLIEQGRQLAKTSGGDLDTARFDLEEARARTAQGELDQAASLINRAAHTLAQHHPIDVGRCYAQLAAVHASAGNLHQSRELYELALEYLEHGPNRALADTCQQFVLVLEQLNDYDTAYTVMKRALTITAELDQRTKSD